MKALYLRVCTPPTPLVVLVRKPSPPALLPASMYILVLYSGVPLVSQFGSVLKRYAKSKYDYGHAYR